MTTTHEPQQFGLTPSSPPAKRQRRWIKPVLFTAVGVALILIGTGIGVAGQQSTINSYKQQVAQLQGQLSTTKTQLSTTKTQLATAQLQARTAQTNARNASSTALAQVKGQYKSKFAALQQQQQKVAGLQRRLQRELGVVAASTISADGVYVVGKDIPPGIYHTSGNGGGFMNQCYYATLGSTDTSNILDNNNFNGLETVDVSGAYAFQINGGCTWHKVG
jgi:uncharacterized protein YlxW (UPF0749 family)